MPLNNLDNLAESWVQANSFTGLLYQNRDQQANEIQRAGQVVPQRPEKGRLRPNPTSRIRSLPPQIQFAATTCAAMPTTPECESAKSG